MRSQLLGILIYIALFVGVLALAIGPLTYLSTEWAWQHPDQVRQGFVK